MTHGIDVAQAAAIINVALIIGTSRQGSEMHKKGTYDWKFNSLTLFWSHLLLLGYSSERRMLQHGEITRIVNLLAM